MRNLIAAIRRLAVAKCEMRTDELCPLFICCAIDCGDERAKHLIAAVIRQFGAELTREPEMFLRERMVPITLRGSPTSEDFRLAPEASLLPVATGEGMRRRRIGGEAVIISGQHFAERGNGFEVPRVIASFIRPIAAWI